MKWLSWVFGSLYVFFCFIGFCVVIMKNGKFMGWVVLLIVIWCFFIILKRVVCVLVGEWFILLMSIILLNIGFVLNENFELLRLNIVVFNILFGMRLGVN